ncbi:NeuD/PglB/VioB family sugar acetyltransferase [Leifsonia sp. NPDC058230]|uniref:NeuD/PglB/VioB family sugar acetyltransferase n=1 Tax=Leifsonia sp. NPDC058230 TaxID=3346391 RepID=UPI0036D83A8E
MTDVVLIAASGLSREVIAADQDTFDVVGILDDNPELHGTMVGGAPVLGGTELAAQLSTALLVCVGSGAGRRRVVERLGLIGVRDDRYATLIDDSVRIPPGCEVGRGSILLAGTVLTADVTIGRHVVMMPHVTVTHDDVVEDFVTLAAGVALGGTVLVRTGAYIGMNAGVRERTTIGPDAIIGMGSVVLGDVPSGETWVGVPAAPLVLAGRNAVGR